MLTNEKDAITVANILPLALPPAPLQLYAVYPGRRYLPAKTRALLTFLIQQVGEAANF